MEEKKKKGKTKEGKVHKISVHLQITRQDYSYALLAAANELNVFTSKYQNTNYFHFRKPIVFVKAET
jgi:hypothetical protein